MNRFLVASIIVCSAVLFSLQLFVSLQPAEVRAQLASGCADGTTEQNLGTLPGGEPVHGCNSSVTFVNADSLCAPGWTVGDIVNDNGLSGVLESIPASAIRWIHMNGDPGWQVGETPNSTKCWGTQSPCAGQTSTPNTLRPVHTSFGAIFELYYNSILFLNTNGGSAASVGNQEGAICVGPPPPPTVSVAPSSAWYNNDFDVSYSATNADLCELWTRDQSHSNAAMQTWGKRADISCSATTAQVQVPDWCETTGTDTCEVRVVGKKNPVTLPPFNFTGGVQTWSVPSGVTEIEVEVWGAQGERGPLQCSPGGGCFAGGNGGSGGYVKTKLQGLTPRETLNVYVGGTGSSGGFNGGQGRTGGGGGASDIRRGGTALTDRIVVAGGGGGGGGSVYYRGESAGGGHAGAGGGLVGQDGQGGGSSANASVSPTSGGTGGDTPNLAGGTFGGAFGIGGESADNCGRSGCPGRGGGGGGGYYGGGAGQSGVLRCCGTLGASAGGGGGGGSSYVNPAFEIPGSTTHKQGVRSGNGQIIITYTPASASAQTEEQFNIDRQSPTVQITAPTDGTTYTADFDIAYDCTDADSGIDQCWLQTKDSAGNFVDRLAIPSGLGQNVTIDTANWCPNFQCQVRVGAKDNSTPDLNQNWSAPAIYNAQAAVTVTDSFDWYNNDFPVFYDAENGSTCTVETNNGGAGWITRYSGASLCGTNKSVNIQIPEWCSADGQDSCRVRVRVTAPSTAEGTQRYNIDLTAPEVTGFRVNGVNANNDPVFADSTATITWNAIDTGGSGISHIEVWVKKGSAGTWEVAPGAGSLSPGTTSYTASLAGITQQGWLFGLHVIDKAKPGGNCITEAGGHCGGVSSDSKDMRPSRGPIQVFPNPKVSLTSVAGWRNQDFTVNYTSTNVDTCEIYSRNGSGGAWTLRSTLPSCSAGTVDVRVGTAPGDWCSADGADACGVRIIGIQTAGGTAQAEQFYNIDLTAPVINTFTAEDTTTGIVADINSDPLQATSPVILEWTGADNESGIDHYEVWRAPDVGGSPGTFSALNTSIGGLTYTDTPPSGAWWYGIHAVDKAAPSGNCIAESGSHCGGVSSDGLDNRPAVGPIQVAFNIPPVVDAGPDQTVPFGLPTVSVNLSGTVTDDGFPNPPSAVTTQWQKAFGPGNVTFSNPNSLVTTATFDASGVYSLQLVADDGADTSFDPVEINVKNDPPIVNAGPATVNVLFGFPLSFAATITDDNLPNPPDNLTIAWRRISGPGTATFSSPSAVSTDVQLSQAGTHQIEISVSDGEKTSTADVVVQYGAPPRYGLVPCGVIIDDPDTPYDETADCEFRHTFLLARNVIDFALWKMVPIIVAVMVVLTGVLFYFQLGSTNTLVLVRRIWRYVGIGVLVLIVSWLALNFLLGIFGFDINIFGQWYNVQLQSGP